jgi:hypothetical protein
MLSAYLFTGTEFHELLRLHHLIYHYQEHREADSEEGFIDYLAAHYLADHSEDDPQHANLPFGCNHKLSSCPSISPALIHAHELNLSSPEFSCSSAEIIHHSPPADGIRASVFQPPRFVS